VEKGLWGVKLLSKLSALNWKAQMTLMLTMTKMVKNQRQRTVVKTTVLELGFASYTHNLFL
jgi:hypothetical protein